MYNNAMAKQRTTSAILTSKKKTAKSNFKARCYKCLIIQLGKLLLFQLHAWECPTIL